MASSITRGMIRISVLRDIYTKHEDKAQVVDLFMITCLGHVQPENKTINSNKLGIANYNLLDLDLLHRGRSVVKHQEITFRQSSRFRRTHRTVLQDLLVNNKTRYHGGYLSYLE
jgi:hypothetical protein